MGWRQRLRRWFEDHRLVTFKYLCERTEAVREECRQERTRLEVRHKSELEARTKAVESLLEKVATTHWRHDRDLGYSLNIRLNPEILGGVSPYRDDMTFLAQMIGRQVEREIASGHYVRSAGEQYVNDLRRAY